MCDRGLQVVDIPEPEVQVEQIDGVWYVVRRSPGHLLRTLNVQQALTEANQADKRREPALAKRLREAAAELRRKISSH
jgi:hypothetical protein